MNPLNPEVRCHPNDVPKQRSLAAAWLSISAPLIRQFKPIAPLDIHRVSELLNPPVSVCTPTTLEFHSSVADDVGGERLILRMATQLNGATGNLSLPIYEIALVRNARTEVVLRWAVEPSRAIAPIVHTLRPDPVPRGTGASIDYYLLAIEAAILTNNADKNNPEDFFTSIPSFSLRSRVFFGGARLG